MCSCHDDARSGPIALRANLNDNNNECQQEIPVFGWIKNSQKSAFFRIFIKP
jgi:hypothetical protein